MKIHIELTVAPDDERLIYPRVAMALDKLSSLNTLTEGFSSGYGIRMPMEFFVDGLRAELWKHESDPKEVETYPDVEIKKAATQ